MWHSMSRLLERDPTRMHRTVWRIKSGESGKRLPKLLQTIIASKLTSNALEGTKFGHFTGNHPRHADFIHENGNLGGSFTEFSQRIAGLRVLEANCSTGNFADLIRLRRELPPSAPPPPHRSRCRRANQWRAGQAQPRSGGCEFPAILPQGAGHDGHPGDGERAEEGTLEETYRGWKEAGLAGCDFEEPAPDEAGRQRRFSPRKREGIEAEHRNGNHPPAEPQTGLPADCRLTRQPLRPAAAVMPAVRTSRGPAAGLDASGSVRASSGETMVARRGGQSRRISSSSTFRIGRQFEPEYTGIYFAACVTGERRQLRDLEPEKGVPCRRPTLTFR